MISSAKHMQRFAEWVSRAVFFSLGVGDRRQNKHEPCHKVLREISQLGDLMLPLGRIRKSPRDLQTSRRGHLSWGRSAKKPFVVIAPYESIGIGKDSFSPGSFK